MAILQYRLTVMFPDEYLYWLATVGVAQVAPHQGKGLVSHRVFQSKRDPHELLIVDEWDGEPQALDYLYREELEGGMTWTQVTAGPDMSRFEGMAQLAEMAQFTERRLDIKELEKALGYPEEGTEQRPVF